MNNNSFWNFINPKFEEWVKGKSFLQVIWGYVWRLYFWVFVLFFILGFIAGFFAAL
jgi:hypothetical protein